MINKLDSLLEESGFSASERKVYRKTIGQGMISSAAATKLTGLPRSTVMAALEELRETGLCRAEKKDGRSLSYEMLEPSAIKPFLGEKVRNLENLMDALGKIDIRPDKTRVELGRGQDSLQKLLELPLRCKNPKWQIIAPRSNALMYLPKSYIAYFKKVRSDRGIVSQTLWEPGSKGQELDIKNILMRKPRYVPANLSKNIPGVLIIFDDDVIFIEGTNSPIFVHVRSPALASTIRIVFELAWRNAKD